MKKLAIIFIIILTYAGFAFAQEEAGDDEDGIRKIKPYYIGFNLSGGLSTNTTAMLSDGSKKPHMALSFSCRTVFYFSAMSGVLVEGGMHYLGAKETQEAYFRRYEIWYGFVSVAYLMRHKGFIFFFGPYFGAAFAGKYSDSYSNSSSTKKYTFPDVGLNIGAGFIVLRHKKFDLYTGLNIKYQLASFTRESSLGSKIMALLVDVTFYFK